MMSVYLYLVPWVPSTLGNTRLHCLDNRNVTAGCANYEKFVFLKEMCILGNLLTIFSKILVCLECDAELTLYISVSSRAEKVTELTVCYH